MDFSNISRYAPVLYSVILSDGKESAYYLDELIKIRNGELILSNEIKNVIIDVVISDLVIKGTELLREAQEFNKTLPEDVDKMTIITSREQVQSGGVL